MFYSKAALPWSKKRVGRFVFVAFNGHCCTVLSGILAMIEVITNVLSIQFFF